MVNGPLWTAEYDPERPQRSNDRSARKHYRRTSPRRRCRFRWPTSDRVRRHEIPAARSGSAGELEEIKRRFKGQPNKIASHARSCWRYKLSFFGIERVVDRALGCGHRRVSAVRCTRVFLSFGLDRPFPKAAFDALDDPIFNAAVFHVRPASKGAFRSTSPHHASYWPISVLKVEAFSRSKSPRRWRPETRDARRFPAPGGIFVALNQMQPRSGAPFARRRDTGDCCAPSR